jgi:hypothetical protein
VKSTPALAALDVGGPHHRWRELGFAVMGEHSWVGEVELRFHPDQPPGLRGWSLRGLSPGTEIAGIPLGEAPDPPEEPGPVHPNRVQGIDHVVVLSPNLDRTLGALESVGLRVRGLREAGDSPPLRQAFLVAGPALLEVVGDVEDPAGPDAPARLWGVTFVAGDLEALAGRLGESLGAPHDAVQPGRRIASVREAAGLGVPVAFISPRG